MSEAASSYDFLVLGADGMQGSIVARDLLESGYHVYLADLYDVRVKSLQSKYPKQAMFAYVDLRDQEEIVHLIQHAGADVVINCAEGDWNINVYRACIDVQVNVIDLGSRTDMTREQIKMHMQFKRIRKTAITGCGSVPGIGSVMLKHAAGKLDSIETIEAGFAWDSNQKLFVVPFSMESILEEFTLPAPVIENRRWRKKHPQENATVRYLRSVGNQRIFLADHPEVFTFYHYFKPWGVKNVRFWAGFPDHSVRVIETLIDLGFSDSRPAHIDGIDITGPHYLGQFLKRLRHPRGYIEWENLWVEVTGRKSRKKVKILMECIVPPIKGWEQAGCNVDTGFPASLIAQMIKYGEIVKRGSYAPEAVVPVKPFFKRLKKKKLLVYENGELIN
ncbi:MAG TPA: saccharopine dehydrogenase C-terminal domain-containing protein [Candidatus Methylomirabilis sp.]|nr:saccharopine dehydrogenase C-terminal domain-containing protein [Candidatus Methylomirabilis sp.]